MIHGMTAYILLISLTSLISMSLIACSKDTQSKHSQSTNANQRQRLPKKSLEKSDEQGMPDASISETENTSHDASGKGILHKQKNITTKARVYLPITIIKNSAKNFASFSDDTLSGRINANKGISVELSAKSALELDLSEWRSNIQYQYWYNDVGLVDLGNIAIKKIFDNDLDKCSEDMRSHCFTAMLIAYLAPLYEKKAHTGTGVYIETKYVKPMHIGYGLLGAIVISTITIMPNQHVLRETDFTFLSKFNIKTDISNALDGINETILVLEYGLSD
ncbi:MAG: hypothetical protein AABZ06_12125 [Bdellovibrionota bacterium]